MSDITWLSHVVQTSPYGFYPLCFFFAAPHAHLEAPARCPPVEEALQAHLITGGPVRPRGVHGDARTDAQAGQAVVLQQASAQDRQYIRAAHDHAHHRRLGLHDL